MISRSATVLRSFLLCLLLSTTWACALWPDDLVEQRRFHVVEPIWKVAVVPFYANPRLSRMAPESGTSAFDAAALVSRFVTESLETLDIDVIPETDVRLAFEGQGQVVPRQSPEVAAMLVAVEFGVDAVLLGEVRRFREREGSAYGSLAPASVDFQVTLYSAPTATRLWTAKFDQTQGAISTNLFASAQYPDGGTRFLTVAELTRFGAELIAKELPLGR